MTTGHKNDKMKSFYFCKCFLNHNVYVKELNYHFNYKNRNYFLEKYHKVLHLKLPSNDYQDKLEALITNIEEQIRNRLSSQKERQKRKAFISKNYDWLHEDILAIGDNSSSIFHPKFLSLLNSINSQDKPIFRNELKQTIVTHSNRIYSFPLFTSQFCSKLVDEIINFEKSSMPKGRPNTMNKYGVNMDELGLDSFIIDLREKYLKPLTSILFSDWGGSNLDSHKAFNVTYRKGEDIDLGCHYDNAEVTLNVSLNDGYEDGELVFGSMRSENSSSHVGYKHQKGFGVLHRGQHLHEALPISEGERYNLIIWLRSSDIRNNQCPMCNEVPSLVLDEEGMGDGFTQNYVNLCTTL